MVVQCLSARPGLAGEVVRGFSLRISSVTILEVSKGPRSVEPSAGMADDSRARAYCFLAFRLAAQYFFIRKLTAFFTAADIFRRLRTVGVTETSSGSREPRVPFRLDPTRCGKFFTTEAISALSPHTCLCSAPFRTISIV
jgi:hypothetical protein